jgi:hypothetical protein
MLGLMLTTSTLLRFMPPHTSNMTSSIVQSSLLSDAEIEDWFEAEECDENQQILTDEELAQKYTDSQIRIVRSSLDFTLHTLVSSVRDKTYFNLSPGYQRRARWDRRKKSLLIESFLMNVPIPSLFLFEKDYNQYEIMDGRQRLEAISEFIENKYALTGLEFWPELQGKKYDDLPGTIQRGLMRRTINAVVLLAETTRTDDSFDIRLIIFRRLNTGGVRLNPQELRNALYPGLFNKALHELSRNDIFTQVWKIPAFTENEDEQPSAELQRNSLYRAMMDCELVLRFFAIRDVVSGKTTGSLRQILDRTMQLYSLDSKEQIAQLKAQFIETLRRITRALGEDFHRLPGEQPSRPLYDALLVAAAAQPTLDLEASSEAIKTRLSTALSVREKYDVLVGRGNTLDSIKDRVKLATSILAG